MLKKTLAAVTIALALAGAAAAQAPAEQKGDAPKASVAEQKDASKRHDHNRDAKQGAPASKTVDANKAKTKKKPLHDHRKEHKQG